MGLVIVAVVVGVLAYRDMRGVGEVYEPATITGITSGVDMTGDGKIEIVPIPVVNLPKAPTLVRSTDFKNTLTPEIKTIVLTQIETNITALKNNPKDAQSWIMLGVNRKTIGDYEGARDVWEYVKVLNPTGIVAWNNLGDLYHFYLKDFKKSEENWKKTIALKPDYIQGYNGLVELYKYSMKEKLPETPAILKAGIAKNPDAIDLIIMLARYYQDAGQVVEAKKAYGDAVIVAERLKNTTLTATLKAELAGIK